ncbi:MAG: hypothetical protein ACLU9Q_10390 [Marvinbryantia sp.]|uniref:hypothetical protein n=1 Tax=Marvinbryantia sp. TaxID=2496532 RepID=UPI00399A8476
MLNNQKKSITLTAESVITVTEGDTTKQVSVEGYRCTISSENPEDISISRYPQGTDGKKLYKEHREQCRADYAAFEDAAYVLQDEMIAAGTE